MGMISGRDKAKNIIEVKELKKVYKVHNRKDDGLFSALKSLFKREFITIAAVNNISFKVKKGDIHALIGPNGSGKSTTIKMLSGILYPTEGYVRVMDYVPWKDRKNYVKKIGVIFGQKSQLSWEIPAIDTYLVHKEMYKIPAVKFKNTLNYMIDTFMLGDIITKPVRNLSLGERMKCEFVCILLHDPELIFLDEPTLGMDIIARDVFRQFIKKINRDKGKTFILTTHDINEIENLSNMVTIINAGNIVYDDSLENLKIHFSNKKEVEVIFSRSLSKKKANAFNLEMRSPLSGKIRIDTSKSDFQSEIFRIFKELPVQDLNIQTLDIESVIKQIYQHKLK